MKRYLAFNDHEFLLVDDVVRHAKSRGCFFRYFDTVDKRFVKPGKRKACKVTGHQEPICNVIADLRSRGGGLTASEYEASFEESDDTMTDWDRSNHAQARRAYLVLQGCGCID